MQLAFEKYASTNPESQSYRLGLRAKQKKIRTLSIDSQFNDMILDHPPSMVGRSRYLLAKLLTNVCSFYIAATK